jgi:hypothetical protein
MFFMFVTQTFPSSVFDDAHNSVYAVRSLAVLLWHEGGVGIIAVAGRADEQTGS